MPKFLTVVYEFTDDSRETMHENMLQRFKTMVASKTESLPGMRIHACGEGDYITQAAAYGDEVIHLSGNCRDVMIAHICAEDRNLNREQAAIIAAQVDPDLK